MLFLSVILLAVGTVQASKKGASAATAVVYGDVIAGPGQSEVIVENTLPVPVRILLNGQIAGTVAARRSDRFVVTDGNHYIKAQSTERNGATSRDVQFYTKSRRFVFKVTSPNITTVSLTREAAYEISVPQTVAAPAPAPAKAPAKGKAPAQAQSADVPIAQTALGQDKAAMFDRLDAQMANTPDPTPAPAAPRPAPAPQAAAAPAPAVATAPAAPTASLLPSTGKMPIAVYTTGRVPESERRVLGTKLMAALVNSGRFLGIERSDEFLSKIEAEHLKQRDSSVDENQVFELGKQFGARYICVASLNPAFGAFQVSARIIDVETAVVVVIAEESGPIKSMDDVDALVFKVVRALLK